MESDFQNRFKEWDQDVSILFSLQEYLKWNFCNITYLQELCLNEIIELKRYFFKGYWFKPQNITKTEEIIMKL